ncbi:MAG TPA: hypothetical protein VGP08_04335, partial [Pyrinomonadaceae bacterium]|nr:hypothetical protein [Pyrinomonadaceae bacterium]
GRTDIYSLGMIFFELVAGQKPLGGRTLAELRQKHVSVPMPSLASVAQDVPEEFGGWVGRAMSKDRADRPQTAGELIDGLRSSLGLAERGRGHGVRFEGVGVDADARGYGSGPSATGRVSPETNADPSGHASAATIVTSDFDSDIPSADRGRETSAQRGKAGGKAAARHDSSRETIVDRAADTRAYSSAVAPHTSALRDAGGASAVASHGSVGTAQVVPETIQEPRRSLVPLVGGGVLALALLGGLGGWLALRDTKSNVNAVGPGVKPTATSVNAAPGVAPNAPPDAPKVEAASYWFEVLETPEAKSGARVAELAPTLKSGKSFRIHFVPKERGYLYIITPDKDGNAQTTMLTGKGGPRVKTNRVGENEDYVFPALAAKPIKLDVQPGTDNTTFIFSPQPLTSLSFFLKDPGQELKPEEVAELEKFRAQFNEVAPALSVVGEGDGRYVAVSVPTTAKGRTLIFDLRVKHE